jgi:hypothetical protein
VLSRQFVSDLGKLEQAPLSECGKIGTDEVFNAGSKPKDLLQHGGYDTGKTKTFRADVSAAADH